MDSVPFYEHCEPTAEYVRNHQLSLLFEYYTEMIKQKKLRVDDSILRNIIQTVLLIYIPDSKRNFGSMKCYAVFGLDNRLLHDIHNSITSILEKNIL